MKQVLSQKEIDSLLSALDTGRLITEDTVEEEDKNKVRAYDFRRPIKLSKEYVNTLHMIFDNFAKISSNSLSNQFRTNIKVTLLSVEQLSFDEFVHSIPSFTVMGVFHCVPLNGNQILELNKHFVMQVIELLCGGSEAKPSSKGKKESFTDIELGIVEDLIQSFLQSYKTVWSEIYGLEPVLDHIETNTSMAQIMSPNEPVALISFGVGIFGANTLMNICIPYVSFEKITDKLSIRSWFDMGKTYDESEYKEEIAERLAGTEVQLLVEMGKTILTVEDFLQLETGDIVQLDLPTDTPMKMYVEDKMHYLVQPGMSRNKLAVQVLQYVEEDVEI